VIHVALAGQATQPLVVLCLGAHADDIEIGCGGALLSLQRAVPNAKFHWVVFSADGTRRQEARKSAGLFMQGSDAEIILKDFKDGYLPYQGAAVKDVFEELKRSVNPDLVFTQWGADAHQDHRLLSELTWNTFRNHQILEYEIPKYDGDLGRPNLFVPLDLAVCEQKIDNLFAAFASQAGKKWFDRETFRGLMRLRGMECNAPSGYAEAFYSRKTILKFD